MKMNTKHAQVRKFCIHIKEWINKHKQPHPHLRYQPSPKWPIHSSIIAKRKSSIHKYIRNKTEYQQNIQSYSNRIPKIPSRLVTYINV